MSVHTFISLFSSLLLPIFFVSYFSYISLFLLLSHVARFSFLPVHSLALSRSLLICFLFPAGITVSFSAVFLIFLFHFPTFACFCATFFSMSSHFLRPPDSAPLLVPKERVFCRMNSPPHVNGFAFPLVGSFLRIGSLGSAHRLQPRSVHDSTSGVLLH